MAGKRGSPPPQKAGSETRIEYDDAFWRKLRKRETRIFVGIHRQLAKLDRIDEIKKLIDDCKILIAASRIEREWAAKKKS